VRWYLDGEHSYLELLTESPSFVNGPLAFYLRHQSAFDRTIDMKPLATPLTQMPQLDYTDKDTWIQLDAGPHHAGLLTSAAYLLRFQTNRSRANQYYTEFLCQPFQAPSGGLPVPSDEEAQETDLQKRPGCNYCHAELEPASSYWGRWNEVGTGYFDPLKYPAFDQACLACAQGTGGCSSHCNNHYIVDAESPSETGYFGWLRPYLFLYQAHLDFVEGGPRMLVLKTSVDDRLPKCLSRKVSTWLMGRAVLSKEESWLAELSLKFVQGGMKFRELVKDIVLSEMYRRVE
jgi:hypothetical protein